MFEVVLTSTSAAKNDEGALYTLELVYAGGFRLEEPAATGAAPGAVHRMPGAAVPLRAPDGADTTREGGFPPLLLDPIDFASLFRQRTAQEQGATASA